LNLSVGLSVSPEGVLWQNGRLYPDTVWGGDWGRSRDVRGVYVGCDTSSQITLGRSLVFSQSKMTAPASKLTETLVQLTQEVAVRGGGVCDVILPSCFKTCENMTIQPCTVFVPRAQSTIDVV